MTNKMNIYTKLIQMKVEENIEKKTPWVNEYGSTHRELYKKEFYQTCNDFKIEYYRNPKDNTLYFKIIPSYFSFPGGYIYWEYYDGMIQEDNDTIILKPIVKKKSRINQ